MSDWAKRLIDEAGKTRVRVKYGYSRGLFGYGEKLEDGGWSVIVDGESEAIWFSSGEIAEYPQVA